MKKALEALVSKTEVQEVQRALTANLEQLEEAGDNKVPTELTDVSLPLIDWWSGVEKYDDRSLEDLYKGLGLSEQKTPGLQDYLDPTCSHNARSPAGQKWLSSAQNTQEPLTVH